MLLGVRVRVSAGPPYSFSQMLQLDDLKTATTLKDVADLLGVKVAMLSHLLYFKPKLELYKKFEIEKKYGGIREINAPEKHLKLVQFRLSQLLQDCIEEINKSRGHAETAAAGEGEGTSRKGDSCPRPCAPCRRFQRN